MKNLTINLAAAWDTFISTFQDGDVFRESQIDISMGTIANRLGWLKTALEAKPDLADNNNWTGVNTFVPSSGNLSLILYREVAFIATGVSPTEAARSGLMRRTRTLPDASGTEAPDADTLVVPVLTTNNKTYTIGNHTGNDGRTIRVFRPGPNNTFSATLRDSAGTTICVFPADASDAMAWVDIEFSALKSPMWLPRGHGGKTTSLSNTI